MKKVKNEQNIILDITVFNILFFNIYYIVFRYMNPSISKATKFIHMANNNLFFLYINKSKR